MIDVNIDKLAQSVGADFMVFTVPSKIQARTKSQEAVKKCYSSLKMGVKKSNR